MFTVPAGVTSVQVDARGGMGGYDYEALFGYPAQGIPGLGGRVQATMNVTPGEVLYIYVGERGYGYNGTYNSTTAYNGGGMHYGGDINAGGGGGATDIRINGQDLTNRILVAGGGGGSGTVTQAGGSGGGLTGGDGNWDHNSGYNQTNSGGKGGTQIVGGAGGSDQGGQVAPAGTLGNGGTEGFGWVSSAATGGGGGGGYYGGGGGEDYAAGGGGSSYTNPSLFQNIVHTQGYQNGSGQLTITYNAMANCASTTRQPVTVTVNTTPTVSAGSNVLTCEGTAVNLIATGADTYTWQPGNLTGATINVMPGVTTTYTVTGELNNGGCTNTGNVTVTVTSVSASAGQAICLDQTAGLSASGADSYTWEPGDLTGSSINVSPGATTTYTVTGHNNVGCNTTAQTTVTVNPLPPVNAGEDQTIYAGSGVTLTATGADSYSWFPVPSNTSGETFTPSTTATYTVTGTYTATGCTNKDQVIVTVLPLAAVSGNTTVCPGSSATLTATGTGPFSWYDAASGGSLVFTGATFTTPALNTATTYWVSDNGSARAPVNVLVTAFPLPVASSPVICTGSNTDLFVSPPSSQTIYWYDAPTAGNLLDSMVMGTTFNVSPATSTVYYAQQQSQQVTQAFNFTGGVQMFTVPAGVTSVQVDARGGMGGYDYEALFGYPAQGIPGLGGRVQATMNVTPGEVLYIYVGERGYGYNGTYNSTTAYNGGGMHYGGDINAGGGGGATDIRINGQDLTNRILVAGGGGGSGTVTQAGGSGGGLTGGDGNWDHNSGYNQTNSGGKGGTQIVGGAGGSDQGGQVAPAGTLGNGGTEGFGWVSSAATGGGGGGGYYGGGGGEDYAGGGGGSSYTNPSLFQNIVHTQGYQNSNGQLIISYNTACTVRLPDSVKVILPPAKPIVTPGGHLTMCVDSSVTLTSSADVGNVWNTGATTPSISVNTPGDYYVTVTGDGSCTAQSDTVNVAVTTPQTYYADADGDGYGNAAIAVQACSPPSGYVTDSTDCNDRNSSVHTGVIPPKPIINGSSGICPGTADRLVSSAANTYLWSTGETTKAISTKSAGFYTVTITRSGGCENASDPFMVAVLPCTSPAGLTVTNITSTSAVLSWDPVNCGKKFKLQIKTANGTWRSFGNITTNSFIVNNLSPNKAYDWQVQTICTNNPLTTSAYTTGPGFKTAKTVAPIASLGTAAEANELWDVTLSPNPAQSITILTIKGKVYSATIMIRDIAGKVLWQKNGVQDVNTRLPLENLANGVYIVSVLDKDKIKTLKLIKQH